MSDKIREISDKIGVRYNDYKDVYAQLTEITNDIAKLEDERNELIENDGRRFLFKKTAVELRDFIRYIKTQQWMSIEYENFENKRSDIVEEAMVVDVYCYQENYSAKVKFIMVLNGYLNKEEFDKFQTKNNTLSGLEYYIKSNRRTKL